MTLKKNKFSKAPVSEVIIGVTFSSGILQLPLLFDVSRVLKKDYPIYELKSPLANQYLEGFRIVTEMNDSHSGPFRIFQRSESRDFLIQIQSNKVYLNWVRKDEESVGNYPGYNAIKTKFDLLLQKVKKIVPHKNFDIDYLDLTYQNRFEWKTYIERLSDIDKIMNLSAPSVVKENALNYLKSEYTYLSPKLNGYGQIQVSSSTTLNDNQILKFQSTLRGNNKDDDQSDWYENAHQDQINLFESIFKEEILESWK